MSDFFLYLVAPVVIGVCTIAMAIVAGFVLWIVLDLAWRSLWSLIDRAVARARYELAWLHVHRGERRR